MAIITCNNILKTYNGNTILDNVSFNINKNEKVAIVGDNGQGKTTLFKIITKQIEADSGFFYIDGEFGYLSQKVIENEDNTLLEEMELAFIKLTNIQKKLDELVKKMETSSNDEIISDYSKLEEQYKNLGGYDYKYEITSLLSKFGFDASYYNRKLNTFSGGERTRACFVKLLLNKPPVLLLDEPTNHLDLVMISWLENYLKTYSGTVIIVSHDPVFIDNFANKVIEIENHKATTYSGNYTFYTTQKQMYYEQQLKKYNLQEKEIKRYEMLIKKFKPKPTKTAFAKSLETKLSKMEKIDKPNNHKKQIKATFEANLEFKVKMHICEDLLFGYERPLCEPLNLVIKNQDKICFMGQNGCGKTTLLQCLMTNKHLISGINTDVRENLKYFYFDQNQKILDDRKTVFDTIQDEFPLMDNTEVRNLLGRFLFSGDDVFKNVEVLSGGERIRLIFALVSLRNYDILYLDEPTNHLDFQTKKVVGEILDDYPGTIIMVSHDRYFINQVANKIIYIQNGKFIIEEGNYNDFIATHDIINNEFTYALKKETNKEKTNKEITVSKDNKKEKLQLNKQIEELMEKLEKLNIEAEDETIQSDWVKYRELAHQIKETEEEIESLMLKYENL